MLVYNTTYNIDEEVLSNFLIWINEVYVPETEKNGILKNSKVTCECWSHRDENNRMHFLCNWEGRK